MNDDEPPFITSVARPGRAVSQRMPVGGGAVFRSMPPNPAAPSHALQELRDMELPVAIELGRARLTLEEFSSLKEGSVLLLDRRASEPVDVYVNERLVARGEVVVVAGKLGVKLTDVVPPGGEM